MFEKEAEEYIKEHSYFDEEFGLISLDVTSKTAFQDGAEFGYNKAFVEVDKNLKAVVPDFNKVNEWHYVKDGDLPKDFGNYVVAFYGSKGSIANGKPCWEELYFDAETLRWVDRDTFGDLPYVNKEGIVIAWKEIVLPKESE